MDYFYIVSICAVMAFAIQSILGFRQIKHFTKIYGQMRKKGRVAIGRNAGKIRSGTIVMFAIDQNSNIIEAQRTQGTTVFAKFKKMDGYKGISIEKLSCDMACVKKENKIVQKCILNAVDIYFKVQRGEEIIQKQAPISQLGTQLGMLKYAISKKINRSV